MTVLSIDGVSCHYGNLQVLWDVSMKVNEGEVVSILGANGAGKSTLIKAVVGLKPPTSGTITFDGHALHQLSPHEISRTGIAYGPEGGGLFRDMTVLENLEMGAYNRSSWEVRDGNLKRVFELFPRLEERHANLSRTLSGGERQMLVMARALMAEPRLIVLDEPTIGLAPLLVDELFATVTRVREEGITVMLVEQNVKQSLEISDRAYVLENGRVVVEGLGADLLTDESVTRAYLGLGV